MEPREIDARRVNMLLAVHLFGWVPMNRDSGYGPDAPDLRQRYPDYSTTWEGMGLVVEAMHTLIYEHSCREPGASTRLGNGWDVNYLALVCRGKTAGWAAGFCFGLDADPDWYEHVAMHPLAAEANTAPMAVALAALKVFGVEVGT